MISPTDRNLANLLRETAKTLRLLDPRRLTPTCDPSATVTVYSGTTVGDLVRELEDTAYQLEQRGGQ
jgi:hypothetical protein